LASGPIPEDRGVSPATARESPVPVGGGESQKWWDPLQRITGKVRSIFPSGNALRNARGNDFLLLAAAGPGVLAVSLARGPMEGTTGET